MNYVLSGLLIVVFTSSFGSARRPNIQWWIRSLKR